jgi:hypothetical protein
MINVSQKFKDIMAENYRPRVKPSVKMFIVDINGNEQIIEIPSKNIKNESFKEEIDPMSRVLPYQRLTFDLIFLTPDERDYYISLFEQATASVKCELWFEQFFNFSVNSESEKIKIATLYMAGEPKINKDKITFEARDLLDFISGKFSTNLRYDDGNSLFINPLMKWLTEVRQNFINNKYIFFAIQKTISNLKNIDAGIIDQRILVLKQSYKDTFLNYLKLKNYYIYFDTNGTFNIRKYLYKETNPVADLTKKLQYELPIETKRDGIGYYKWNQNIITEKVQADVQANSSYAFEYSLFQEIISKSDSAYMIFDVDGKTFNTIDYVISTKSPLSARPIVLEISQAKEQEMINPYGSIYEEDNPLWVKEAEFIMDRVLEASSYFTAGTNISTNSLPIFFIELGDRIFVDTKTTKKSGIVIEREISYNGNVKETMLIHGE